MTARFHKTTSFRTARAEVRFSVSEGTVVYDGKYHGTDLADVYLGGSDFNVSAESGSVWRISWDYTNIPNEYILVF